MAKIKIVSDGTPEGTKIVDADTGEDMHLRGLTDIEWKSAITDPVTGEVAAIAEWKISANDFAIATLYFQRVPIEVIGEMETK